MCLKYNFHSFKINLKLHHTFQMFKFTTFLGISNKNGSFLVNLKVKVLKPLRICFLWRKFRRRNFESKRFSSVRFSYFEGGKVSERNQKTYLWVSVFFCGLKREISKVKKALSCVRFNFLVWKVEMCGKESKKILFVGEDFLWVSNRNFKSKKKDFLCKSFLFRSRNMCEIEQKTFICVLALEIPKVKKVSPCVRFSDLESGNYGKESKKSYLWVNIFCGLALEFQK